MSVRTTLSEPGSQHRVDAEREATKGMFLHAARRRGKDGYVHVLQLCDVAYHHVRFEFPWLVLRSAAAHDAGDFHVGGGFKSLYCVASYVAIAHYGYPYLSFHFLLYVFVVC